MEPAARAIELWRDRLAIMARNIADLGDTDDVRRLRARLASGAPYEGATLVAARRVAAALDALWSDYLLLSRTVDEAAALCRRTLLRPAREEEALALLDGVSIRLPSVSVPVRARGLLDAAERHDAVTPGEVLDAMVADFDAARRGVAAIAAAETAGRIKLAALRADPGARGSSLASRLDAAARVLDRDPLGAAGTLAAVGAAVVEGRAAAEAAERDCVALAEALARARADLDAWHLALTRRDAARRRAEGLVVLPSASAPPETAVDLGAWLDRLAAAAPAGDGNAVRLGLERWTAACLAARGAVAAEADALASRLAERDDLRGRFRALQAKSEALARRGGLSRGVPAGLAAALEGAPFDAARVRPLLATFEAALAASVHAPEP